MKFFLTNPEDLIQSHWKNNCFYEQNELAFVKQFIPAGCTIVDVGANVGNHAIYFDKFYSPKTVYVIEPNPEAFTTMLMNSALNYCHTINFDYLGIVLGNSQGHARIKSSSVNNIGDTTYEKSLHGAPMHVGDSIFGHIHIDLLKIDVEGMEMEVLDGFSSTINSSRPALYIEVRSSQEEEFQLWLSENEYIIAQVLSIYDTYKNFLAIPKERSPT